MQRVLLLMPTTSYRTSDFLDAARRLGVEVVVGSNHRQVLEAFSGGRTLTLSFEPVGKGVSEITAHARRYPFSAIVGTDEEATVLAASASKALGLPHNSPESVTAAHDKYRFRCLLEEAGMRSPWFQLVSLREDLPAAAAQANYPCVLKPLCLSASRGVIRADDEAAFLAACDRIAAILQATAGLAEASQREAILAEAFIPGQEVALEGLVDGGRLQVLALFDKPDPLYGPFFEETLYVTPSRLSDSQQQAIVGETAEAASALGLKEGPIHAELRLNNRGAWMIELAARSIGGLCSRALSFSHGVRLEELILRHALALPISGLEREARAAGVMMIPIPGAGRLRAVTGLDAARALPGIDEVIISVPIGDELVPLPEGDRYLGFIFARAREPGEVEAALRGAHQRLSFDIAPMSP
jgi:biotin carboxylase